MKAISYRLLVALAVVSLLSLVTACSPGKTPDPRRFAIVVDSSIEDNVTSSVTPYAITGSVLVLDGGALPGAVQWRAVSAAGETDGSAAVGADGAWTASVALRPGDNTITFTVADAEGEESLVVTYNASYAFTGQLSITPDVAYVNEARTLTARIALTDPTTNPAEVQLIQIDAAAKAVVAQLTDDGNLDNGDEIEGDGIYSGEFTISATAAGTVDYRVQAGRTEGGPALSEVFDVLVVEHLTQAAFETTLTTQATYQDQLDSAAKQGDKAVEDTVDAIVDALENDPSVAQVGESDSGRGVWIVYSSGIGGVLYAPQTDIRSGGRVDTAEPAPDEGRLVSYKPYGHFYKPNMTGAGPVKQDDDNTVESNKAIGIAAAFFDFGNDEVIQSLPKLEENCFTTRLIQYNTAGSGTVEDFKALGDYGVIMISSHGDSFYRGILNLWGETFGWNGPFGQVVLFSNMTATAANRVTYEDDLVRGRLVLWGTYYGILPTFITTYAGALPNSLVSMGICRGGWNGTMAQAFLSRGAGAYLSFTDYVGNVFAINRGNELIDSLLTPGNTLDDAFVPGQVETDADPAEYVMWGADTLSLEIAGIQDPSFESNSISQAWTADGDARIIPGLGASVPTDGSFMAVISTGLGFTTATGTLRQKICLADEAANISFDWNFFSEEFMEWVGSQYQDTFSVTITEVDNPGNTATLLHETIDTLSGQVGQVANSFDRGDVYATGWRTVSQAIPASMQGKQVELTFFATDVGDSIYDTAVLIDNIEIVATK